MAPAASAAEVKMYRRMADWYDRPECDALRAAWGPYPATPAALQSWPGFVAVTNAFLDSDAADDRPAVATAAEPVAAEAEESEVGFEVGQSMGGRGGRDARGASVRPRASRGSSCNSSSRGLAAGGAARGEPLVEK